MDDVSGIVISISAYMYLNRFFKHHLLWYNFSLVTVGYSDMTRDQIVENVLKTVVQLSQKFPGGSNNIRSLHIKTTSSASIPFFVSLGKICSRRQGCIMSYRIMFASCQ